jgi:hypothetical protein
MSIPPNTTQRDLVRLSLLVCGRSGEKHQPDAKAQSSAKVEPWRGYDR